MSNPSDDSTAEPGTVSRDELLDLLADIATEGNEEYKTARKQGREFRRGVGWGKTTTADEIADHFDLDLHSAMNR